MNVVMIGAGHARLVLAVCFPEQGSHDVDCILPKRPVHI